MFFYKIKSLYKLERFVLDFVLSIIRARYIDLRTKVPSIFTSLLRSLYKIVSRVSISTSLDREKSNFPRFRNIEIRMHLYNDMRFHLFLSKKRSSTARDSYDRTDDRQTDPPILHRPRGLTLIGSTIPRPRILLPSPSLNFPPARKLSTCGNFQDPVHVVAIAFPWPRFERLSANFYRSSTALDAILRDLRLECASLPHLFKTRPNISIHASMCTVSNKSLHSRSFHARFFPPLPFSSTGPRGIKREGEWFLLTAESFYSPTTGIVAGNKDISRGSRGTIQGLPFQEAGQFGQTFGEVIYALRAIIIEAPHENASTYLSFARDSTREKREMENVVFFPFPWIFRFEEDDVTMRVFLMIEWWSVEN